MNSQFFKSVFQKKYCIPVVFGLLFSTAIISALWADQVLGKLELLALWVGIIPISAGIIFLLSKLEFDIPQRAGAAFSQTRLFFIVSFVLLEALFVFSLLSNYPGFCSTDSNDIIDQALGISQYKNHFRYEGLSNHHPIFYTFVFWLTWVITGSPSDPTFSVFCFLLVQTFFVSAGIAWSLGWLNKHCGSRLIVFLISVVTVLSPVLLVHAITMWKDVPFAVVVLVLMLKLFDFSKKEKLNKSDVICLLVLVLAMSLFRNNGIYICLILLVYMIVVFKQSRRKILICLASLLVVFGIIQGPVFTTASVSQGHFAETVSVPLQQIAAVAEDKNGRITNEQREFISNIRPIDEIADAYKPTSTNPVKFATSFNDEYLEAHKIEFIKTWVEIAVANPGISFRAWVDLTRGYWQPGYCSDIGTRSSVYKESPVSVTGSDFDPHDYFIALKELFPGLFCMGNVIWIVLAIFCVMLLRCETSSRKEIACFIPLLALELTVLLAAPIVWDFRYILSLYISVPFLLFLGNVFGLRERVSKDKLQIKS